MTDIELIEGLWAYDSGATDSGIKNDLAKKSILEKIRDEDGRIAEEFLVSLLSDGRYTIDDAANFIDWLRDNDVGI